MFSLTRSLSFSFERSSVVQCPKTIHPTVGDPPYVSGAPPRKCLPSFETFDACRKGIMQQQPGSGCWDSMAEEITVIALRIGIF